MVYGYEVLIFLVPTTENNLHKLNSTVLITCFKKRHFRKILFYEITVITRKEIFFIILFLRVMLVFLRVMEIDPYFIIFKIYTHLLNKNSSYFEIMIMFLIITKCVKKIVF